LRAAVPLTREKAPPRNTEVPSGATVSALISPSTTGTNRASIAPVRWLKLKSLVRGRVSSPSAVLTRVKVPATITVSPAVAMALIVPSSTCGVMSDGLALTPRSWATWTAAAGLAGRPGISARRRAGRSAPAPGRGEPQLATLRTGS